MFQKSVCSQHGRCDCSSTTPSLHNQHLSYAVLQYKWDIPYHPFPKPERNSIESNQKAVVSEERFDEVGLGNDNNQTLEESQHCSVQFS
jgi:hypothetical protein